MTQTQTQNTGSPLAAMEKKVAEAQAADKTAAAAGPALAPVPQQAEAAKTAKI
ncbi:hypothetical protein [Ferrovibrio xuzhouensis]|uniref:Uncharacterized protein n=1 Tax=Ferrovibrio xuzhouensis TaxID=1576914 RepID=A0ABV7VD53_9PROT